VLPQQGQGLQLGQHMSMVPQWKVAQSMSLVLELLRQKKQEPEPPSVQHMSLVLEPPQVLHMSMVPQELQQVLHMSLVLELAADFGWGRQQ